MKLYSKEHLKSGRIFFDKKAPKFGLIFTTFTCGLMIVALFASTVLQKNYIVRAQGTLKSSDLEYISSNTNGVVVNVLKHEGEEVEQGDVIMIVSDGKETLQEEALVKQLTHLKNKIEVMDKYQLSLEQSKNLMKNEGIEQEYYAYLEYYLNEKENSHYSLSKELKRLEKKEKELSKWQKEQIQLRQQIKELNNEKNECEIKKHQTELQKIETMLTTLEKEDASKNHSNDQILELKKNQKMLAEKVKNKQERIDLKNGLKNKLRNLNNKIKVIQEEIENLNEQVNNPANTKNSMYAQMLMELGKNRTQVESKIKELETNIKISSDEKETYKIKASQYGRIHYLNPIYIGVSIQQNQVVAEVSTLQPSRMIAEAYINAHDISKIRVRQDVKVAINGVNSSKYGTLNGKLVEIDTGTVTQETPEGRALLYRVKVSLDKTELQHKDNIIKGIPSMPVEARIIYEKETYFDWLLEKLNYKS